MKTLESLYQEILADTELQLSFGSAMKENRLEEFLKENGGSFPEGETGETGRAGRRGAGQRGRRRLRT